MDIRKQIEQYEPVNGQEEHDKRIILTKFLNMEDNILTRENEIAHFTCSSWITNKNRDKVIMLYHNIYDSWAWSGGHADGDENFLHVALKEANEELGLNSIKPIKEDIVSIDIQPCASHIKREKFVNSHLHINVTFLFEADENEKPHIKDDENSDIKWFSLEDAVSISTQPEMKPIYRKLNDRLRNF